LAFVTIFYWDLKSYISSREDKVVDKDLTVIEESKKTLTLKVPSPVWKVRFSSA